MHHRALAGLAVGAVLLLGACSSSGGTAAPSAAAPSVAAPSAEASTAASGSPAAGGGAACTQSAEAGPVSVSIKNFAFNPAAVQAKVGQVITFTNGDSTSHTATLDDGSCSTGTISPSSSDGLLFTAPGTYAFHCKIHPSMTGTITVS